MTIEMSDEASLTRDASQYLTFTLKDEEFGIEILRVQEIKGISHITPIPNMPEHIKGVMNLRGAVVPIIDLRSKFSMPETPYNRFTVIIVVTIRDKITGLVVDAVSDVLNIEGSNIEPADQLGVGCDAYYLSGIAKSGDQLITLLDMEKLVDFGEQDFQIAT